MAILPNRTELTTPADGDLYVTTDVSDTTDAATGTDKKITWASIKTALASIFVTGPVSATDNAIARFDVTTGKLIQDSSATISDDGILTITNATDVASAQVLVLQGDRATPATNDEVYVSFKLSDSVGNQDEFARIRAVVEDVTSTSEDASIRFSIMQAGSLTAKLSIISTALLPASNDAVALGSASLQFSDLYLAEGGVINWDNGDATLTQSGNDVTLAGASLTARVKPRTGTTTSSATPTINIDDVDFYSLTAQAADITSFTTNLSGTPTEGQKLWIAVTGTAARAITWGASFENGPVALPTTTVTTTRLDIGFIWNTVTSKWRCVASGSTV